MRFEVWHRTLDVNLVGFVRTIHAVLPHLLAGGGGSIVNTSSGGSLGTDPMHVAYNASKAAVNQITRHVADNHGTKGIRCNAVMPGLVMGETQERQDHSRWSRWPPRRVSIRRTGGRRRHRCRDNACRTTDCGLYAAGRTAVGLCVNSYVSGLSLADWVFSGRRAAEHAVAPEPSQGLPNR